MDLDRELEAARAAARRAGEIILGHYRADDAAPQAKSDGTPVTIADLEANQAILDHLRAAFPADAFLAEETADDPARLASRRVWIIDPLDGTRDFVRRTGEFAVHVALAVDGVPTVAVVHAPVLGSTFWAVAGGGAYEVVDGGDRRLAVSAATELAQFRSGVSHLGANDNLRRFLAESPLAARARPVGASLKMMMVARGELEISLCLTDYEREWDTCAPELIVREAGGTMTDLDGNPLRYNQPDLRRLRGMLISNGTRHDELLAMVRPFYR